jgi:hypothetical protein
MMTTSDIWSSSTSNSNTNYQSFYFNNFNQYNTIDNNHFDYQPLSDNSSPYLIDPYTHLFPNNYPVDSYSTQTVYNSIPMESSTYIPPTDSYQHLYSTHTDPNVAIPPASSSSIHYQSTSSQWDSGTIKMPSHDSMYKNSSCSTSRNGCQAAFFLLLFDLYKTKMRENMSDF